MLWLLLQTVLFHGKIKPVDSAYTLYGLLYVSGGFLAMLALRNGQIASYMTDAFSSVMLEPARFFMFLLIFSTWASDTFAFAVGKVKGKNKLCPSISPAKRRKGLWEALSAPSSRLSSFRLFSSFPSSTP